MLLGATDTVVRRFKATPDRNRVKMKSLDRCEARRLSRIDVERIDLERGRAAGHEVCGTPDMDFDFATDSFEFVRKVEPLDDERPTGKLALWGAGVRRSFRGRTGGNTYTVAPEVPFVGVDYTAGRLMFGTAVSWFDATGRYRLANAGSGAVRLDLGGVYPYARYASGCRGPSRKSCRTELWAVGAMGQGDLVRGTDATAGAPPSSDARMRLGLAGFRQQVAKAGSLEFALRGDIGSAVIEGGEHLGRSTGDASLGGDASRGRIGVEGSLTRKVGAVVFRPFTQVAQRYDGGSSTSGTGTELAGGLELISADGRLRVQATGRTLVTQGLARYEEESVGATIELRRGTVVAGRPAVWRRGDACERPVALRRSPVDRNVSRCARNSLCSHGSRSVAHPGRSRMGSGIRRIVGYALRAGHGQVGDRAGTPSSRRPPLDAKGIAPPGEPGGHSRASAGHSEQ
ncbi:MAG: hypothetical protein J4F98_05240 [Acidobacteria bacterium]|nr:hypothetical protein [Acidobacteriota bacterium]